MPYRKRTVKIYGDFLTHEDDEGNECHMRAGEWIEFKRKQTPNDMRRLLEFAEMENAANNELQMQMDEAVSFLARKIVSWNFTDLFTDGEPLPDPTEETLNELDLDDIFDILEMYGEVGAPSKN